MWVKRRLILRRIINYYYPKIIKRMRPG